MTAETPHGEEPTYLREIPLVADHNAYHLGQIVQIRKALGDWRWRKTLKIDPNFWMTHFYLGLAYVQEGKYGAAISEFHKGKTLSEDDSNVIALLGYVHGVAGKRSEAQKILDKLILLPKQQYTSPFSIAEIYIGLGEKDRAFEWLEKAYEDRTWLLRILKVEPIFDPIRSDPRFADLLRRIGLAP